MWVINVLISAARHEGTKSLGFRFVVEPSCMLVPNRLDERGLLLCLGRNALFRLFGSFSVLGFSNLWFWPIRVSAREQLYR